MKAHDRRTKRATVHEQPDMLPHYDFSKGIRGEYAARYREGTNSVLLDADVLKVFPDSRAVNEALRTLIRVSATRRTKRSRPSKR